MREGLFNQTLEETTRLLQIPRGMILQVMLGALSVSCQRWLRVRCPRGKKGNTNLYLLTVADSGGGKSRLENAFFGPITDYNEKLFDSLKAGDKYYETELDLWKEDEKELKRQYRRASSEEREDLKEKLLKHNREKPDTPLPLDFFFQDATEKALLTGLQNRWNMGFLLSGEADNILNGYLFRQSTALNELWGSGNCIVDRVKEKITLRNTLFSICLQTQPVSFRKFMDQRGKKYSEDGLFARILTVISDIPFGKRSMLPLDEPNHSPYKDQFNERVLQFLSLGLTDSPEERVLSFSPEAERLWIDYTCLIESLMSKEHNAPLSDMTGFASKIMEQASRIAALVHIANSDDDEISADCFQYAMTLMQGYACVFREHIAATHDLVNKADKAFSKMLSLYGEHTNLNAYGNIRIFRKDLYSKGIVRSSEEADQVLRLLSFWGVIYEDEGGLLFQPDGKRGTLKAAYYSMQEYYYYRPHQMTI
nr:DUF3987 domain-containing protein [Oceanospirillum sediminis]